MKIAIHQPNFFPYMGFFQKMEQVDVFCIMYHCQFEKNNYQNRFNIGDRWYSMSVSRHIESIKDKKYLNPYVDWNKIKKGIKKDLSIFDKHITEDLYLTNINIILELKEILGIKTRIEFDYPTELKGTDRLVDIIKYYGCDEYLSGVSGSKYLEVEKFEGIKLEYQQNINTNPVINCI